MFDGEFWKSFWSNALSSLLVGILLSTLIVWLINKLRKPNFEISVNIGHGVNNQKSLALILKNKSRIAINSNELNWAFYFELHFKPAIGSCGMTSINSQPVYSISGFNSDPCFPKSSIKLCDISVNIDDKFPYDWIDEAKFYTSIYTSRGLWSPKWQKLKFWEKKIEVLDEYSTKVVFKITEIIT